MSKLYSHTYMSLDGVIESPERWSSPFFSDEMGRDLTTRLESASTMVLGRVTYQEFASFWPRQSDDVPFATLNNTIKKLVVSDSLRSAEWQNTSIISDSDMEELKLKAEGNFHITGSGTLVRNWTSAQERGFVRRLRLLARHDRRLPGRVKPGLPVCSRAGPRNCASIADARSS